MDRQKTRRKIFRLGRRGTSGTDYGILVGLIALIAISAVAVLGPQLTIYFDEVNYEFGMEVTGNLTEEQMIAHADLEDIISAINTGDHYKPLCFKGTSGADILDVRDYPGERCFLLGEGDDQITATGSVLVRPEGGNDYVYLAGDGRADIMWTSGHDTFEIQHPDQIIYFDAANMADATLVPADLDTRYGIASVTVDFGARGSVYVPNAFNTTRGPAHGPSRYIFNDADFLREEFSASLIDSQIAAGEPTIYGTAEHDEISPGTGDSRVVSGDGDDVIIHTGGNDYYEPGRDEDRVIFSRFDSDAARFSRSANGRNVIVSQDGMSVEINDHGQREKLTWTYFWEFRDGVVLGGAEAYERSIRDQEEDGTFYLHGSGDDDVFYPSAGNEKVHPYAGDDVIYYSSGDLGIKGKNNNGFDILDMSEFSSDEVSIASLNGTHFVFTTPNGVVTAEDQNNNAIADERAIENFVFSDVTMTDAQIRSQLGMVEP